MPRGRPRKTPDAVLVRSAELIGWALGGIEREIVETRNRLAALTKQAADLRARLGARASRAVAQVGAGVAGEAEAPVKRRRKRRLTPEGRKRLSDNMKRRWAERRKAANK